jgi:hypothetical protein
MRAVHDAGEARDREIRAGAAHKHTAGQVREIERAPSPGTTATHPRHKKIHTRKRPAHTPS